MNLKNINHIIILWGLHQKLPVTFLLYDLECYFLNDVHIQLILDTKKTVCSKNH